MKWISLVSVLLVSLVATAAPKPPAKKAAAKSAVTAKRKTTAAKPTRSGARKPVASAKSSTRATAKTASGKARPTAKSRYSRARVTTRRWTPGQYSPDPDRYKEIQQALKEKGYLNTEPTGEWGPESQNALRQFQRDQKIDGDGNLNSLSLIALGLGPKRPEQTQSSLP